MMETPRRRIMVTSSLNETSTDHIGNRVVVRGITPPSPISLYSRLMGRYLKTT
jgi:hypothetical protein